MMNDLEIRYARADEVDELLDLFEEVAGERLWIGTEPGFDRARNRVAFLEAFARPIATPFWVARADGKVVGTLNVFDHRYAGLVIGMLVRAQYRRRGIGQALLDRVDAWACEHAVKELHLHVFPHNEAARALYLKAGFQEMERFERDVVRKSGEVWDAILMRKQFD